MKDQDLEKRIVSLLKRKGSIKGENTLKRILSKNGVKISFRRLRRICFHSESIEVEVRFGNGECKLDDKCPVCLSEMIPIVNLDLEGNKKVLGYKCQTCNFNSTSHGKPYLYIFRLKNHDF